MSRISTNQKRFCTSQTPPRAKKEVARIFKAEIFHCDALDVFRVQVKKQINKKKATNSLSLPMLPKHQLIILLSIVNLFLLQKGLSRSVLDHWHFAHCFHSLYKSSFYENTVMTPSRLCSGVLQCLLIWKMIFQLAVKNCRFSKIQFC